MIRDMASLSDRFRPYAERLLIMADLASIPVTVVETLRSPAQQQINLARGVSWTTHSKHLTGDAIDVCPTAYLTIKNWNPSGPLWETLGQIGEGVGCAWGGRWTRTPDRPHFEYKASSNIHSEVI